MKHAARKAAASGNVLALCLWMAVGGLDDLPEARAEPLPENAAKAAYLYKFLPFVTWPSAALSANEQVNICVLEPDSLGPLLDRVVLDQRIDGRPLAVRRVSGAAEADRCHVLYAPDASHPRAAEVLTSLRGTPVLTVTDGDSTIAGHGIIHFAQVDGRLRFHIDDIAAARSGLRLSSKLLGLALSVTSRAEGSR